MSRPGDDRAAAALLARFAAIRIINLDHRDDRRRDMRAELARLGFKPGEPRVAFHSASRFDDPGGFPTAGARGCFHSHLAVLEAAQAAGMASVLIIEDDVDFARDATERIPHTLAALDPLDWSIFYGGALDWSGDRNTPGPIARIDSERGLIGAHLVAFDAAAMALAIPFLRAMLDRPPGAPDGGPMHVDGAYSWLRRAHPMLQTYIATPEIGHQRPSRTDIHRASLVDRIPLLRMMAPALRRIKRLR